ncbi:hypothetical protein [Pseudothauera rhizosphaerae]|uniref:Uncharacterized protein n=1 Tax=Pseudothauera rhizosphaerae TaxID=2565932 RepID=A0A4S4AJ18_9RHOO|nr:hypothetical protein [Pseudothauera rhizosphaerae]THF59368.1 hypothetical protein E6O51_15355 [Pseudothauera rhizosphaerae]
MNSMALILYHKQSTSGMVRFARFGDTVLAARLESIGTDVLPHPGPLLSRAADRLGLPAGAVRVDGEFRADMLAPGGTLDVRLGEFTTIDPPFDAVTAAEGRFVTLTEIRGIPDTERDVLRLVYEHVLG